jgi:dihydrofolate reductase
MKRRNAVSTTPAPAESSPAAAGRKVTFGGANSLDNFFARADHSVDWLRWSDDAAGIMNDYWKTVDTILMGRRTWDVSRAMSKGSGGSFGKSIQCYVFSRTLPAEKSPGLEIVTSDAVEFVRNLKRQPGKDICCMGGGDFAKSLFEAGLIDELGLNIHPVLLGSGIPLFHELKRQINLELLECRRLQKDCVYVRYRVVHADRQGASPKRV